MATQSSTLVWRIPWTEEPGGLQSTGSPSIWTQLKGLSTLQGHILQAGYSGVAALQLLWRWAHNLTQQNTPGNNPSWVSQQSKDITLLRMWFYYYYFFLKNLIRDFPGGPLEDFAFQCRECRFDLTGGLRSNMPHDPKKRIRIWWSILNMINIIKKELNP